MSKFSVNDKVSFINEKQDGIIRDISADGKCIVEIEDGFTIEARESELVLIKTSHPVQQKKIEVKEEATVQLELIRNLSLAEDALYLVSCPAVSGMVSTGPADYYLVNTTSYDALTGCSFRRNKILDGITSAIIPPASQQLITRIKREDAFDKGDLLIQVLFHKKGEHDAVAGVQREINLQFPELKNAKAHLTSPYAFCNVQQIISIAPAAEIQLDELQKKFSAKDLREAIVTPKPSQKKHSDNRNSSIYEVDLHIEELTDNITGLSNSDMLQMQLSYFRKKLDEAILQKSWKIIFIHGVGNGRLKAAIRNELKESGLKFTDGSFERYGGGATEVNL
jgi:hypothetical protein